MLKILALSGRVMSEIIASDFFWHGRLLLDYKVQTKGNVIKKYRKLRAKSYVVHILKEIKVSYVEIEQLFQGGFAPPTFIFDGLIHKNSRYLLCDTLKVTCKHQYGGALAFIKSRSLFWIAYYYGCMNALNGLFLFVNPEDEKTLESLCKQFIREVKDPLVTYILDIFPNYEPGPSVVKELCQRATKVGSTFMSKFWPCCRPIELCILTVARYGSLELLECVLLLSNLTQTQLDNLLVQYFTGVKNWRALSVDVVQTLIKYGADPSVTLNHTGTSVKEIFESFFLRSLDTNKQKKPRNF